MKKALIRVPGILVILGAILVFNGSLQRVYDEASLQLFLSAKRAYQYGDYHFDARGGLIYNVDRAERYFMKALELDPNLPYLQHQLARIAFLKGNFPEALERINIELETDPSPSSYYVRGLILGYMDRFDEAANDYEEFLAVRPTNWAAINDYAWVLLKAGRAEDAAQATLKGLEIHHNNPWLLNTNAIAFYELGRIEEARQQARAAVKAVAPMREEEWLVAYPGNDPRVAGEGLLALQDSIMRNMHTIAVEAHAKRYNEVVDIDAP